MSDLKPDDTGDHGSGPHTCMKCCAGTWNDDDWCDDCREDARLENERLDALSTPSPASKEDA